MITVFFDYRDVVHLEFLLPGLIITKESYLNVMRRLRKAICKKRFELWQGNSWCLHHDNAPFHTALIISNFLANNSTHIVLQPRYSHDLAPVTSGCSIKSKYGGNRVPNRRQFWKRTFLTVLMTGKTLA